MALRHHVGPILVTLAATVLASAQAPAVTTVRLSRPVPIDGLLALADGTLLAASGYAGRRLWRIAPDGTVAELAAGLAGPIHVAEDAHGARYASNFSDDGTIARLDRDGRLTTFAKVPQGPSGLAVGPDGWLYVAIYGAAAGTGHSVYRVSPAGEAEVFVEGDPLAAPVGLTFDAAGNLYVANAIDGRILKVTPSRQVSVFARLPKGPGTFSTGHLVHVGGRLFASGNSSHVIYLVMPSGTSCVFAGSGQPGERDGAGPEAEFRIPNGLAIAPDGRTLFVVNGGGGLDDHIRRIALPPSNQLTCG
jgi:sugar lactone lactonase YvrE